LESVGERGRMNLSEWSDSHHWNEKRDPVTTNYTRHPPY